MAKELYVEDERKMKVIDVTETVDSITMMTPAISEIGEVIMENDLSKASFDVDVDVGPSSSSKRSATVRALTGMMQITADPEMQSVLGSMAMMNMEGEGISEVRGLLPSEANQNGRCTAHRSRGRGNDGGYAEPEARSQRGVPTGCG